MRLYLQLLLAVLLVDDIVAHGNLLCPLPRQYRDERPVDWTHWMGIGPNNEFAPGLGNAPNLNANIGGGTGGHAQVGLSLALSHARTLARSLALLLARSLAKHT